MSLMVCLELKPEKPELRDLLLAARPRHGPVCGDWHWRVPIAELKYEGCPEILEELLLTLQEKVNVRAADHLGAQPLGHLLPPVKGQARQLLELQVLPVWLQAIVDIEIRIFRIRERLVPPVDWDDEEHPPAFHVHLVWQEVIPKTNYVPLLLPSLSEEARQELLVHLPCPVLFEACQVLDFSSVPS